MKSLLPCTLAILLTACAGTPAPPGDPSGRYDMVYDSPVLEPIDLDAVPRVVPVPETRTEAGNKSPYTVLGRTYRVMNSEAGYVETGRASWYGRKFHGHLTSNGEVYDMFRLSAAHRTLPIPSYLNVTNLENGRSVVVRVNDRGPFHEDRIVDLSYAAARMLGYAEDGTARVRIEALVPDDGRTLASSATPAPRSADFETSPERVVEERRMIEAGEGEEYLQVGAFSNLDSARRLLAALNNLTTLPVFIRSEEGENSGTILHRVRLGPVSETMELQGLIQRIIDAGLGTPFKIRR